jgi:hypothetical protein
VVRRRQATPRDLAQVEFDRRELMRRLRILWITLTVVPVLAGAWWAARSTRVPPDTIPPHG